MPQTRALELASDARNGIGLHRWLQPKHMRWVATGAAPEKGKNPKCHHSLFLLWGSRMPPQC